MEEPHWTLDELAERVDAALAVDYAGQPSGRVRDVPDRRAIRWYTTIGLIDRPVAHRGRTALYGPRHLLQLVAVKRLQARGLPLVAIQQELAGATDTQLARVARLPATAPPTPHVVPATAPAAEIAPGPFRSRTAALRQPRPAFWLERPTAATASEGIEAPEAPVGVDAGEGTAWALGVDGVATLRGVRLSQGVTLLLEPGRELGAADVAAVLEAARPLQAVLHARGLAGPPPGHPALRPSGDPAAPGPAGDPAAGSGPPSSPAAPGPSSDPPAHRPAAARPGGRAESRRERP
jgi:DNA-binding transcriptional MerR regulator